MIKFRKAHSLDEMEMLLNGGIFGQFTVPQTQRYAGFVGKTLTFTTPSKVITFVQGAAGDGTLSRGEIQAQIEGAGASLVMRFFDNGRFGIYKPSSPIGIALTFSASDASPLLGFGSDVAGKVFAPEPTTPPYFKNIYPAETGYFVVTVE